LIKNKIVIPHFSVTIWQRKISREVAKSLKFYEVETNQCKNEKMDNILSDLDDLPSGIFADNL
jgi:hypothetical protein